MEASSKSATPKTKQVQSPQVTLRSTSAKTKSVGDETSARDSTKTKKTPASGPPDGSKRAKMDQEAEVPHVVETPGQMVT